MRLWSWRVGVAVAVAPWSARAQTVSDQISNQTYASGTSASVQGTVMQAGPTVIVQSGATVAYQATKSIILLPGFDAQTGSSFSASIVAAPLATSTTDGFTNAAKIGLDVPTSQNLTTANALAGSLPSNWPSGTATRSVTSNGSAQTQVPGAFSGQLQVDKNGAATYSLPLWVVPGAAGMEPKLALAYSSQAGNGPLGFGWALSGLSSISRGPTNKAIDGFNRSVQFARNDCYYLDGQRLMVTTGNDGVDQTEYHTIVDSFTRIVVEGSDANGNGPGYFKGWTKSGLIMEFGNTADSAFKPGGRVETLTWAVNRISDTAGNSMTFTYDVSDPNSQRISRIDYTIHGSGNPFAAVVFTWEDRSSHDPSYAYVGGSLVRSTQRIKTIQCLYHGTEVRAYEFQYANNPINQRSLLQSVAVRSSYSAPGVGSGGTVYLPALTFTYGTDANPGFGNNPSAVVPGPPPVITVSDAGYPSNPVAQGTGFVDLDGDGKADLVQNLDGTAHAWLNRNGAWVAASSAYNVPYPIAFSNHNDSSLRFVDLNGDGLLDLVWYHVDGNGATSVGAYTNNGSGWQPAPGFNPPQPIAADKQAPTGCRFIDLNGDGLPDMIINGGLSANGTVYSAAAYLNTGSGWTSAPQWTPPPRMDGGSGLVDLSKGVMFVDLNGDGLPDMIQNYYSGSDGILHGAWLNTGSGWAPSPQYDPANSNLPAFNVQDSTFGTNAITGVEFVDLNGDGLPDIVAANGGNAQNYVAPSAWMNTGNGWVANPSFAPRGNLANNHESTGAAFFDVNGDGLPDEVQAYSDGSPATQRVAYNNGSGFGPWTTAGAPQTPIYQLGWYNQNVTDFADLQGRGTLDQLGRWQLSGNSASAYIPNNSNPMQDRLVTVTTGLGVSAQIIYKPITDSSVYVPPAADPDNAGNYSRPAYPLSDVIGAAYVVSEVDYDEDGPSGPTTYPVTYQYSGLRAHATRGSLGFAWVSSTDGRTNLQTKTWYNQPSSPTVPPTGSSWAPDWQAWLDADLAGLPQKTEVRWLASGGSGTLISHTAYAYTDEVTHNQRSAYPYAHIVENDNYQVSLLNSADLTAPSSTLTTTVCDLDGNATSIDVASLDTSGNPDGFSRITTNSYYPAIKTSTDWILGRLQTSTVESVRPAAPGTVLTSSDLDIIRTSSFTYDPTTHLLTSETVESNAAGANNTLTTTYGYDSFGNRNQVTETGYGLADHPSATSGELFSTNATGTGSRVSTTNYDSEGRLPQSSSNALGQSESYTYDPGLGVRISLTGPNQLPTAWKYDAFGRETEEDRADQTKTTVAYNWTGGMGSAVVYYVETDADGAPPTLTGFDKFGRARYSYVVTGGRFTADGVIPSSTAIVVRRTDYDNQGRPWQTSLPYYLGDTAYVGSRVTQFDPIGRPLSVCTADDAVAGGPFPMDGTGTFSGAYFTTSYSYLGLTASVSQQRIGGASDGTFATSTTKNSQGWVVSVVRNSGAAASAADRGEVDYVHDALGQVRSTTTVSTGSPGSATTELRYDILGRKIRMIDPTMGTWTYAYNSAGEMVQQTDNKQQTTSLYYDQLGRLFRREEPEGRTCWIYDTAPRAGGSWIGKLASTAIFPSAPPNNAYFSTTETYAYDGYGRPSSTTKTIGDPFLTNFAVSSYTFSQSYDQWGHVATVTYPNNFVVHNVYNSLGILREIRDGRGAITSYTNDTPVNMVFWEAAGYDVWGGVASSTLGNGVVSGRVVSALTGRLSSTYDFQPINPGTNLNRTDYTYDTFGNVNTRTDAMRNVLERFTYDGLNRLTQTSGPGSTVTVVYDQLGNIANKSDVGAYNYSGYGPHAVSSAGGRSYAYDANGNMISGAGRTMVWTSFNQAAQIAASGSTSQFHFGADHERLEQTTSDGVTTVYLGSFEETFDATGRFIEKRCYLDGPSGRLAVRVENASASVRTRWFHQDALGSVTAVSDEWGNVETSYSYDPWGKQVAVVQNGAGTTSDGAWTNPRGFTDHEMLPALGLIHMNGRVYDPGLGRFLSADPNVGDPGDAQDYNRFSYVGNNPLNATDPTGFFKFSEVIPAVVGIVAGAVVTVLTAGGGAAVMTAFWSTLIHAGIGAVVAGGAAGGFASGFSASLLNGGSVGDAFRSGAIGAVTGAATAAAAYGIGSYFSEGRFGSVGSWADRALAHGLFDGAVTAAEGGNFRSGFYAGALSAAASPLITKVGGEAEDWHVAERTAIAATVGGTASVVGGGKFANGAVTSAFDHLFNEEAHAQADRSYKLGLASILHSQGDLVGHSFLVGIQPSGEIDAEGYYPADNGRPLDKGAVRDNTAEYNELIEGKLRGAIHWVDVDEVTYQSAFKDMDSFNTGHIYNILAVPVKGSWVCSTVAEAVFARATGIHYYDATTPLGLYNEMRDDYLGIGFYGVVHTGADIHVYDFKK